MDWLTTYYLSKESVPDITWIGIGSACVRDSNPENMQQFPPWISSEFSKSGSDLTCCLINIDPKFESPLLLPQLYPELKEIWVSPDLTVRVFSSGRLECIYVGVGLEYYEFVNGDYKIQENSLAPLDTINKLVMSNSKLLVSGIFTGMSNDLLDKYFTNLYSSSHTYTTNITYNFMNDLYGSCMVSLLENYPLIDWNSKQIIKPELLVQTIGPEIITEIRKIFDGQINGLELKLQGLAISQLKNLLNCEGYLYRNYLNKSFQDHMKLAHSRSKFSSINFDYFDPSNLDLMRDLMYKTYSPYIQVLKSIKSDDKNLDLLDILIHTIPSDPKQIYEWTNSYSKILNLI